MSLFSSLVDHTRALLLLTMPATPQLTPLYLHNPEIAQLDQSWGSQAPSLASYVTASSGFFPGLLVPRGTGGERRKRGKKKTAHLADQITDEAKSREYRAFETFLAANSSEPPYTLSLYDMIWCVCVCVSRFSGCPSSTGQL